MDANTTFKLWYGEGKQDTTPSVAKDAFKAVQQHFEQSTILTKKEKRLLREGACIEEVLNEVSTSLEKYELRTQSSKTRKWLQKSSEIICHYGNVLDVFVQHHPEYVSLVWGTMKLLFTSVVNHAETLKLVAKSIWQVGVRLPRIKIASVLYSTSQIRAAVENLYSCILEFLLLAHAWCTESRLRHIIHSFTRPPKLQYEDVLQRISTGADNIMELATLGSQAEIRVMHTTQSGKLEEIISQLKDTDQTYKGQVDGLTHVVSGLRVSTEEYGKKLDAIMILVEASGMTINDLMAKVETFQAIQTSAQLNTNHQIEELNLSQILTSLSPKFEDPETCYKYHVFSRNRRISGRGRNTSTNQFWLSPKLTEWSSSSTSSLIILKGPFSVREALRDFGVDVLQTLKTAGVPTLWALPGLGNSRQNAMATASELMKYLTYQALRLAALEPPEGSVTTPESAQ
ncbi:hypothetical protein Cob_v012568 [Colletotrichum orbiculare MAFF 240422]|uniref:DUF7708 domain-containing protein n=1 Tax=Colletotrichum orbiculare (strain 104-T / ATCC 96160 / CBS 514.97 / LARS 414 / MAFF 240422) TaxID=1213857 RepID=A0A484F919_COLOR|nr:hypothetical protein Cob_v012568 [Colletotrichum orbiculare MAFF 240422]